MVKKLISLSILLFFIGCGVSENSLPMPLPKNHSTVNYGLTILQTNDDPLQGYNLLVTPTIKAAWGVSENLELSVKTFGLGLGLELKHGLILDKTFVLSWGGEGDFSFPMVGYLTSTVIPINKEFINFVSNAFYFVGAKIYSGILYRNYVFALNGKIGYLDNADFLPDMGSSSSTSYPGLVGQISFAFHVRETNTSFVTLGFETGYILPLNLFYASGTFTF